MVFIHFSNLLFAYLWPYVPSAKLVHSVSNPWQKLLPPNLFSFSRLVLKPLLRSVLGVHWKDWCWSWNSNTLATWCEELTHLKDPDAGKDWGQEEKGTTEDKMVGWHHRLNGHGFGWTLAVSDEKGGLECCGSWGCKESSDMTERLNWTESPSIVKPCSFIFLNSMETLRLMSSPIFLEAFLNHLNARGFPALLNSLGTYIYPLN